MLRNISRTEARVRGSGAAKGSFISNSSGSIARVLARATPDACPAIARMGTCPPQTVGARAPASGAPGLAAPGSQTSIAADDWHAQEGSGHPPDVWKRVAHLDVADAKKSVSS